MPNKRKILLDMDGVIVDLNPMLLERVNEEFGTDYNESDLKSFRYDKCMEEEHAEYIYEQWHDPHLYDDVDWSDGAKDAVEKLCELGRVVVLSSPMVGHGSSKLRWLYSHGFRQRDVVLATDKNLVHGHVLIDDRPRNVENFPNRSILVDKPYNQNSDHSPRAKNWDDIIEYTKEFFDIRERHKILS